MGGKETFAQRASSSRISSQRRYARSRQSSIHSGSSFLREIRRITSSFSPGGTVSCSTSVTNPHLYSRSARSRIGSLVLLLIEALSTSCGTGARAVGCHPPFAATRSRSPRSGFRRGRPDLVRNAQQMQHLRFVVLHVRERHAGEDAAHRALDLVPERANRTVAAAHAVAQLSRMRLAEALRKEAAPEHLDDVPGRD